MLRRRPNLSVYGALDPVGYTSAFVPIAMSWSVDRIVLPKALSSVLQRRLGSIYVFSGVIIVALVPAFQAGLETVSAALSHNPHRTSLFFVCGCISGGLVSCFRNMIVCLVSAVGASLCVALSGSLAGPIVSAFWLLLGGFIAGLTIILALRFRIPHIIAQFCQGDLEPQASSVWCCVKDLHQPAFFFDAHHKLVRCNLAARHLALRPDDIANAILPRGRSDKQRLAVKARTDATLHYYAIEWLHPTLLVFCLRDISDEIRQDAELRAALHTDPLTGLQNRLGLERALAAFEGAQPVPSYALFYIDLNGFKAVNDTFGHDAGDRILKIVAQRFTDAINVPKVVCRLGGDEFAILVDARLSPDRANALAKRIEAALDAPMQIAGHTISIAAAVGYTLSEVGERDVGAVIRRADLNMYRRKAELKSETLTVGRAVA